MNGSLTGPERARQDLADILTEHGRVEMGEAMRLMAERGHPPSRIGRARKALKVDTIRSGPLGSRQTFHWQLPTTCPTCSRPFAPVEDSVSARWGEDGAEVGDYWRERSALMESASHDRELQSRPPPVPQYEPSAPPRCDACGRASAMERGSRCPFQSSSGIRCVGTMK